MPNRRTHAAVGAGTGTLLLGIWEIFDQHRKVQRGEQARIDWVSVGLQGVLGAAVGGVAGVLPDLLEPATNPKHRRFFHSLSCAILAAGGIHELLKRVKDPMVRKLIITAALGYGTHLGLDARTMQGLPYY
jgi:LexA-binding, inner membrane-associated putative hydrolase